MPDDAILDTVYDPRAVEPQIYAKWEQAAAFRATPDGRPHERSYTIVIPLPNVTGALHLGHALNNTLQDILTRYHRMRGFNTLWQPGTDHAGIATQAVVERRIRELEGKSRHDLGRDELVRRIWQWKDEYQKRIIDQLKMMGCSCDWERTRFTLDEVCARAVRHQFFNLFKDGLIFRGKRLVNWDTELQTAVSDDEIYYETVKGHFWHFKYPVIDRKPGEPEHVIIATTRPETMLGDTAVAVHPDPEGYFRKRDAELREDIDKAAGKERAELQAKLESLTARRESHLAGLVRLRDMARDGRLLMLPLVERRIPLVADEWADPTLGTGCVKITPAHDPNDYEVALRQKLPMINVLTADGKIARIIEPDGKVNPNSGRYEGLPFATEGREQVLADLESRGLLHEIEDHDVEIAHSDRSKTPIEPYLSDQWFLQMGDVDASTLQRHGLALPESDDFAVTLGDGSKTRGLAQAAMDVVNNGRIKIFPQRYTKTYLDWLGEKRDWCISRQLWWGHRIPIWTHRMSRSQWKSLLAEREDAKFLPLLFSIEGRSPTLFVQALRDDGRMYAIAGAPGALYMGMEFDQQVPDDELVTWLFAVRDETDVYAGEKLETWLDRFRFTRDDDVLDTWFSSALWPFSTLGWPDQTESLKQYYPGTVLVTSRDIITNWVARMVMFGLYAIGDIPFDHVYVHPKILDARGETMSKSKGNGVDPVDIIYTHGADALRYTMADMTTETQDIRMPVEYVCPHCAKLVDQAMALKAEEQARKSRGQKLTRRLQPSDCLRVTCPHKECGKEFATQWAEAELKQKLGVARETSEKFDIGRNFCNKLWNAARFAFMNLQDTPCHKLDIAALNPEDRWILSRLSQTIRAYHQCMSAYQFSASIKELREFFWDALCDWYIELTKPRMMGEPRAEATKRRSDEATKDVASGVFTGRTIGGDEGTEERRDEGKAKQVLAFCIDQILRLLHPTIPFITERLWSQLNDIAPARGLPGITDLVADRLLILAPFPPVEGYPALDDAAILTTFAELQDATRGVRDLRLNCAVSPKDKVTVTIVVPGEHTEAFKRHSHIVQHMANIGELRVCAEASRPRNAGSVTIGSLRVYVHDISDDEAELKRATKALEAAVTQIAAKDSKLRNEKFVANAKPEIVEAERQRLAELLAQRKALEEHLAELQG